VCKAVDSNEATVSCTEKQCHQTYHVTCLRSFLSHDEALNEQTFVCPLHQCATCQAIGKAIFAGLCYFNLLLWLVSFFNALTLLVGWQEGHPACKIRVMECWCGCLSGVRCRLAYGPVDATASHCILFQ